ncbi:MAG: hypothetical protein HYY44_03425 [Deltaproteobacteria bacterium]|nr:hypothetical protein [Deltaproteobacteria bacterium]
MTLYYVTLATEPASLEDYLKSVFPSRTFETFSNDHLSGFRHDNPEEGTKGGDRQEYYFLKQKTLLYLITDLFEENDAIQKFEDFISSLRFD